MIFLAGGPPHQDMWDPKPAAPLEIRGPFHPISTNVPGNLQRPNLPMGMGVEYEELSAENREAIEKYVQARARAFEL